MQIKLLQITIALLYMGCVSRSYSDSHSDPNLLVGVKAGSSLDALIPKFEILDGIGTITYQYFPNLPQSRASVRVFGDSKKTADFYVVPFCAALAVIESFNETDLKLMGKNILQANLAFGGKIQANVAYVPVTNNLLSKSIDPAKFYSFCHEDNFTTVRQAFQYRAQRIALILQDDGLLSIGGSLLPIRYLKGMTPPELDEISDEVQSSLEHFNALREHIFKTTNEAVLARKVTEETGLQLAELDAVVEATLSTLAGRQARKNFVYKQSTGSIIDVRSSTVYVVDNVTRLVNRLAQLFGFQLSKDMASKLPN